MAASASRHQTVEFQANLPELIALKFPTPRGPFQTKGGERFMYTLTDGRVMFVDPPLAQQITRLGVNVRETFYIQLKWSGKRDDPKNWLMWLSPETEKARTEAEGVVPDITPASDLENQLADSLAVANAHRMVGEQANGTFVVPALPHSPPTKSAQPLAPAQGAEKQGSAPASATPAPAATTPTKAAYGYGAAMIEFLVMAGRAAQAAQRTLGAEGAGLQLDSRDVCALATTAFIQAAREGWIVWRPGEVER
jgi:hypothetical protein